MRLVRLRIGRCRLLGGQILSRILLEGRACQERLEALVVGRGVNSRREDYVQTLYVLCDGPVFQVVGALTVEADAETDMVLAQLAAEIRDIALKLPRYEELTQKQLEKAAAEKAGSEAEKARTDEQAKLDALTAETAALREQ